MLKEGLFQAAAAIVSLQDRTGKINFRVEEIDQSSFSTLSLVFLLILLLGLLAILVYMAVQAWKKYASRLPQVKVRLEQRSYEEKAPAAFSMNHLFIEDEVEKHLKEEERVIVRLLRQREGRCEQGTLCMISGFSKATLSRLLSELEERGIVYKEKKGKKNIVHLKL